MKKSCCVDDVNITPRNSSCSMILGGDCSHGHLRKSSSFTCENKQDIKSHNRECVNLLTRENLHGSDSYKVSYFPSYLSLKKFQVTSAKTYSFLKENFYNNFDYSRLQSDKSSKEKSLLSGLNEDFDCTSASLINNNSLSQEEFSYVNNSCFSQHYGMSRTYGKSRTRSSVNALSESETDDDPLPENVTRRHVNKATNRRSVSQVNESHISNNNSNHTTARNSSHHSTQNYSIVQNSFTPISSHTDGFNLKKSAYRADDNHQSEFSNQSISSSPSSPVIDISTVQYTPIDRFRWFLWRSIYLKIIKCVNFDVWCLARVHKYRRFIVLLILLPFLAYLIYGGLERDSNSQLFRDIKSNVIAFSSYFYNSTSNSFLYKEGHVIDHSSEQSSCSRKCSGVLFSVFFAIVNFFSNLINKVGGMFSTQDSPTPVLHATEFAYSKDDTNKLQKEISDIHLQFQNLLQSYQNFEKSVIEKLEKLSVDNDLKNSHVEITSLNNRMKEFEEKISLFSKTTKTCCGEKWTVADFTTHFEKHLLAALKNIVESDKTENSPYLFFKEWLNSNHDTYEEKLTNKLRMELDQLKNTKMKLDDNSKATIEKIVQQYLDSISKNINTFSTVTDYTADINSLDVVKKLIKEAIMLYDADKTGLVDYALESSGGSVLSTRCSESYAEKDGTISVLGFSLWSAHTSPRTAIQPGMQPGECWAFKGSQGFLVIQLSYTIYPTGFTLEHIPASLSPSGSIDSAPNHFSVWGLISEKDNEGFLLGKYFYDHNGDPMQYFPVQNTYEEPFSFIEIKIHSNHGNLEYTCLYRFRVHGDKPKL